LKYYPDKDKDTPVKKIVPFLRRISEPTAWVNSLDNSASVDPKALRKHSHVYMSLQL
jgi:hypothetical protein